MLTRICAIVSLTAAFSASDVPRNPFSTQAQLKPGGLPLTTNDINQSQESKPPGLAWLQQQNAYSSYSPNNVHNPTLFGQTEPPALIAPSQEVLSQISPSVSSGIHSGVYSVPDQSISSGVQVSNKCLRSNGQFPTEACNKFINCWNGMATEQACPDGLVFSARGLYCDYPERVDCSQRSMVNLAYSPPSTSQEYITRVPTSTAFTTQAPVLGSPTSTVHDIHILPSRTGGASNQRCIHARGQFPTDICNQYVNCWDGSAVEQFCPTGLVFNPSKLHCDYPENVNCNGKLIVAPLSTNTLVGNDVLTSPAPVQWSNPSTISTPPPVFSTTRVPVINVNEALRKKCLTPRGIYPSSACSKFVSCWDDIVEEKECPEGFLFSTNGYCDAADNVNCLERTKLTKEGANEVECPKESGTFRDKNTCNAYYTCVFNKVVARFLCPEGLYFSEKIGVCDYANKVECSQEDSISKQKESSDKSECPSENGTFRDKNKCNAFYTCLFNKVVARHKCPEGFNFNDNIGVCDYADRVDCSKNSLNFQWKNGSYNQHNINTIGYECPVEFGTYRDSKNCSLYYTCSSRKVVAKYSCPEGFSFNDDIGVCDYAERVDCTKPPKMFQIKPNGIAQFPSDLQDKVDRCKPGTSFRLNPQCTAACLCRNGIAEIIQCPAGLAYDSGLDKCVPSHLARC